MEISNSIHVDGVTSVHSEVITYWNFGKQEDWVIKIVKQFNTHAIQLVCILVDSFGVVVLGQEPLIHLKIQNNTIEGAHGQAFVIGIMVW